MKPLRKARRAATLLRGLGRRAWAIRLGAFLLVLLVTCQHLMVIMKHVADSGSPNNSNEAVRLLHMLQHHDDSQPSVYAWEQEEEDPLSTSAADGFFPDDLLQEIQRIELKSVTPTYGLVLVGIFCRAEDVAARELHRATSHRLAPRGVTPRFVICQRPHHNSSIGTAAAASSSLQAEARLHGDLLLLDCEENMDSGKSPLYFRTVAQRYPHYHFYAKTDLDTYNLYFNLAYALDAAPRCGLYMGQWRRLYQDRYNVGHLYVLSRDLVAIIENCRSGCPDHHTYEDVVIGQYVTRLTSAAGRGGGDDDGRDRIQWGSWGDRHVVYGADGTRLGDPERKGGPPIRELFTPWVVLVHGVKPHDWMDATRYFRDVLSVETVRASAHENFVDGETTRYSRRGDWDCGGSGFGSRDGGGGGGLHDSRDGGAPRRRRRGGQSSGWKGRF